MKNWKTTLTGLVTAIVNIFVLFGVPPFVGYTADQQTLLVGSATTIGLFLISIFAKDSNVTGGTKAQTAEAKRRV